MAIRSDFFGISEKFVASFESGLFVERKEPTVLGVTMFSATSLTLKTHHGHTLVLNSDQFHPFPSEGLLVLVMLHRYPTN